MGAERTNFELLGERESASAKGARLREHERTMAMTPRERALLALRLGRSLKSYASLADLAR
jgi:hypothetical protein